MEKEKEKEAPRVSAEDIAMEAQRDEKKALRDKLSQVNVSAIKDINEIKDLLDEILKFLLK